MTDQIPLFNADSVSSASLNYFTITEHMTITGFGLATGESVTFEMALFPEGTRTQGCNPCLLPPHLNPEATSHQALTCSGGWNITLSAANPVVVLDGPVGIPIRAVYNGFVFGGFPLTSEVVANPTRVGPISEAQSGCVEPELIPIFGNDGTTVIFRAHAA
jgi:hypothetical protein